MEQVSDGLRDDEQRRRANRRLALVLGAVALTFYFGIILFNPL